MWKSCVCPKCILFARFSFYEFCVSLLNYSWLPNSFQLIVLGRQIIYPIFQWYVISWSASVDTAWYVALNHLILLLASIGITASEWYICNRGCDVVIGFGVLKVWDRLWVYLVYRPFIDIKKWFYHHALTSFTIFRHCTNLHSIFSIGPTYTNKLVCTVRISLTSCSP